MMPQITTPARITRVRPRFEIMTTFTVRLRGYSKRQVQELAERVERSLAGSGELTGAELRRELEERGLDVVLRGYDPEEVHAAVLEWERRLNEQA